MWLRFVENGGRQLLNMSLCGIVRRIDKGLFFYGPPRKEPDDSIVWILEFKTEEDAEYWLLMIETSLCNGDYHLMINYNFD